MRSISEAAPSTTNNVANTSRLLYKAFLCHERLEKGAVLDLLRQTLRQHGVPDEKVFYDEYMKRGGSIADTTETRLGAGLRASEYLIAFLTPEFFKKKCPMWELETFIGMMEGDRRKKLLPVFLRVSADECKDIANQRMQKEEKEFLGFSGDIEKLVRVLKKVNAQFGIDAKGWHMSDSDVVTSIMKHAFEIDISNGRTTMNFERKIHDVAACNKQLCDYPSCAASIISNLKKCFAVPPKPKYTRMNFENPQRPEKRLREKLLLEESSAVAAVGVTGMGGVGKTTCLIGIANDCEVGKKFSDGVLWIQLSRHTKYEELRGIFVNILKYARYHWKTKNPEIALNPRTSLDDIVERTGEALMEKRCLIVLDDIWPFKNYEIGLDYFKKIVVHSCSMLLSTRFRKVMKRFNADGVIVGDLDYDTASALFDDWCGGKPKGDEEKNLKEGILALCSNMALAICIAGSNVKRIAESDGKKRGLVRVLRRLEWNRGKLEELDHTGEDRNLHAVIQTTIDSISDEDDKEGYYDLAVFNNKTRVSNQALEALWNIERDDVEDRVDLYVACSLATRKVPVESESRSSYYVELHDQHLAYARYNRCLEKERSLHARLLNGYENLQDDENGKVWWESERLDDGYFYENYARHFVISGRVQYLAELLMDYRWIAIRCREQNITRLLGDFDLAISNFGPDEYSAAVERNVTSDSALKALRLVRAALRASQAALWERKNEVPFQLVGRLLVHSDENIFIRRLLDGARQWEQQPWLYPVTQCFECPMSGASQVLRANSSVLSVALCRKARNLVACGTKSGHVRLWDLRSGECNRMLQGHQGGVNSVAVTEDGSVVVSGSDDCTVRLWDGKSGECNHVLRGHHGWVNSVAVTEDGGVVVSGSSDGTVRLWDGKSGECNHVLQGHQGGVNSLAVTEDGGVVVSGSSDGTVRLWDGKSGECNHVLRGHHGWVNSVAVTEDGSVVVSGSDDCTVRLWDGKSGECNHVLRGHHGWVKSVAVTEGGGVVVSGSPDGTVRLWDGKSGECNHVLQGHHGLVDSVAVTEDGGVVVSGSSDRTVRLWDGKSGECNHVLQGHHGLVKSVAVTEDGGVVVSGSYDGTVRLWDGKSGECNHVLQGHHGLVKSVAVTEDGGVVVSGSSDRTVRLWNGKSGECNHVLQGHHGLVKSVAVTEDGGVVVSGSYDGTVRLWDGKSGECNHVLQGHQGLVKSVAVTEDGGVVVSGSDDCTVRLWDGKSGECNHVLQGHHGVVKSVAVTEDGGVVVSGSYDGTVRLWDGKSGECNHVLQGHHVWVKSVAVTEDGGVVVSGSNDGTVRLWDGKSGECLKTASVNCRGTFRGRDLLRLARLIGLLTMRSEAESCTPDHRSFLPETCRITVESGVVEVAQGTGTMMSATFDITDLILVSNLNGSQRVVVLGRQLFVLEIMNASKP